VAEAIGLPDPLKYIPAQKADMIAQTARFPRAAFVLSLYAAKGYGYGVVGSAHARED